MNAERRAQEHLHAIRQLMERATIYRAISAPTALTGGLLATGLAAAILHGQSQLENGHLDATLFFLAWLLVLGLTLAANGLFIWREARRRGEPVVSARLILALECAAPSLLTGGALSIGLLQTSGSALFSCVFWLICYGLALLSTRTFAPASILVLGWAFLLSGLGCFVYLVNQTILPDLGLPMPERFHPATIMGVTFGGYHLFYAACTWPRRRRDLDAVERRPLVLHDEPPV